MKEKVIYIVFLAIFILCCVTAIIMNKNEKESLKTRGNYIAGLMDDYYVKNGNYPSRLDEILPKIVKSTKDMDKHNSFCPYDEFAFLIGKGYCFTNGQSILIMQGKYGNSLVLNLNTQPRKWKTENDVGLN